MKNPVVFEENYKQLTSQNLSDEIEFRFLIIGDPQFGLIDKDCCWDAEVELSREMIKRMNEWKPRFSIILGDLANAFPGSDLRPPEVESFKATYSELNSNIPLFLLCGNHDVGNHPTLEAVKQYRSDFGRDYYCLSITSSLFFLMLNSNTLISHVEEESDAQWNWIENQVALLEERMKECEENGEPFLTVVFTHHPLFLDCVDEEDELNDFKTCIGNLPRKYFHFPKQSRKRLVRFLKRIQVQTIFSGHLHANGGAEDPEFGLKQVITTALGFQLGSSQPGYRVARIKKEIDHYDLKFAYVPLKEAIQYKSLEEMDNLLYNKIEEGESPQIV